MKFDTDKVTLETAMNPLGWVFAEYELGKRITKDMVDFDTDAWDVQVNVHGIVLFRNKETARRLLKIGGWDELS